jgi:hypothetical protein
MGAALAQCKGGGRTDQSEASAVTARRHSIGVHIALTPRAARLSGVRAQNEGTLRRPARAARHSGVRAPNEASSDLPRLAQHAIPACAPQTKLGRRYVGNGGRCCLTTRAFPQAPGALYSESEREQVVSFRALRPLPGEQSPRKSNSARHTAAPSARATRNRGTRAGLERI